MNIDINQVFNEEPKKPFQYNLFLSYSKIGDDEIFKQIKKIFITGISLINPSSFKHNHLQINKISLDDISLMKEYMASMGIEVFLKKYNEEDINYLIKNVIYDVEKLDFVDINVHMNWKKSLVYKAEFNVKNKSNNLSNLVHILKKHNEANYIINFLKPEKLSEYCIKIKYGSDVYIISFDYKKKLL